MKPATIVITLTTLAALAAAGPILPRDDSASGSDLAARSYDGEMIMARNIDTGSEHLSVRSPDGHGGGDVQEEQDYLET